LSIDRTTVHSPEKSICAEAGTAADATATTAMTTLITLRFTVVLSTKPKKKRPGFGVTKPRASCLAKAGLHPYHANSAFKRNTRGFIYEVGDCHPGVFGTYV
jgi:hypothetical protein